MKAMLGYKRDNWFCNLDTPQEIEKSCLIKISHSPFWYALLYWIENSVDKLLTIMGDECKFTKASDGKHETQNSEQKLK